MFKTIPYKQSRVLALTRTFVAALLFLALSLTVASSMALHAKPLGLVVTDLKLNPGNVVGGNPSTGTVTLSGAAPTGGAVVSLSTNQTSVTVPGTVTVPAGSSSATFTISTSAVTSYTTVTITAKLGSSSKDAMLPISAPGIKDVTISPASIKLGQTATGTVTLTGPAPAGNVAVKLTAAGNGSVQGQLFVLGGSTSATFPVTTGIGSDTGTIVIYAELNGDKKSGSVSLVPTELSNLQISPNSVAGGTTATPTGTITLDALAPKDGASVQLSSNTSSAKCPSSLLVPSNSTYNTFSIQSFAVASPVTAKITAKYRDTSKTATFNIQAATVTKLTASPTTIKYGLTSTISLEVTISGIAGPDGVRVPITSSNTAVIPVPGTPVVNYRYNSVSVTPVGVYYVGKTTVVTLTATLNGVSKSVDITVNPS